MKSCLVILMAIVLVSPELARAAQMKLSDLRQICAGRDAASRSACTFYILGVTDGASIGAGVAKDTSHFCIPAGVSSQKMVLIVKTATAKDLAAFPQDENMPAVSFVAAAINMAFPCNK